MNKKVIVRAPGRINLIGEHTDYNLGYVLPAAINRYLEFTIESTEKDLIEVRALDLGESARIKCKTPEFSASAWTNYCAGIIAQVNIRGFKVDPFICSFGGNIPPGAGLASSAALSCGFLMAINEFFKLGLSKLEIAQMAQRSENDFVGVNCGIMDQFACVFGQKDSLIKIDCRSLGHETINIDFEDCELLLVDTGVKHKLAETEYNKRRMECDQGVAVLHNRNNTIKSLRDVTFRDLRDVKGMLSPDVYNRCHFVISENQRVVAAQEAIEGNNLIKLGELIAASHAGLRDEYQVSCIELDVLADFANNYEGVLGARMMGGGFGGCTINLIKSEYMLAFKSDVLSYYKAATGHDTNCYEIALTDGAHVQNAR